MALPVATFFITAVLYASVGFGGGSTYNALLVLSGMDYHILPAVALTCNIIVVAGGVLRFGLAGGIPLKKIAPFIITSVPFAWLGGRLPISEVVFVGVLAASLAIAGLQMLIQEQPMDTSVRRQPPLLSAGIGAGLGFLSGLVGIGGGIFLAPILHLSRWDTARVIAGSCSFFILVNSMSGLAGQIMKLENTAMIDEIANYWMLFPAVLIGGQIGSRFGALKLSETLLRRITALLILYVAARLALRWYNMAAE